jgi:hypothetical protein
MEGYIQFEAIGGPNNLLNEGRTSRGKLCTSIDALIYAKHRNGKRFLIPIEWKYAESYGDNRYFDEVEIDKQTGLEKRNKSGRTRGEERKFRYYNLIENSNQLKVNEVIKCSNYEPFYQLMRQTLLVEQIIVEQIPTLEADDFLHIHVIPDDNTELLYKKYTCTDSSMEDTWRSCITNQEKYRIISPEAIWSKQSTNTLLYQYLKSRYW